jgi:hypothetical protein
MSGIMEEAGVTITKENKKDIDRALHSLVNVEYKNCSATWKELKKIQQTEEGKKTILQTLQDL